PDHHRDVRHAEFQARLRRARDGFRLTAFLRADPRIGAGRVDERDHRNAETVGHLHQPRRLAVALWARHAEIVPDAAFGVGALFLAENADAVAAEAAEAADDCLVVAEFAVARD